MLGQSLGESLPRVGHIAVQLVADRLHGNGVRLARPEFFLRAGRIKFLAHSHGELRLIHAGVPVELLVYLTRNRLDGRKLLPRGQPCPTAQDSAAQVRLFAAVYLVLFFQQAHGVGAQVHKKRLVRLTGRARQHRALAHYLIDGGPAVHTAVMQPPGLVIQLQRGQIFRTVDLQQKKRRVSRGDGRIFLHHTEPVSGNDSRLFFKIILDVP